MRRLRHLIFCSGLATALLPVSGHADLEVDLTATIINSTCSLEASNSGLINFATVGAGYFADGVTAETDYPGGEEFTLKITDCPVGEDSISRITFNFVPQSSPFPANNKQVFPNEITEADNGAGNVGVVIFSTDKSPRANVLNIDGTSRAVYEPPLDLNTTWTFYARMQRINNATAITTGQVSSRVLVDVYYE